MEVYNNGNNDSHDSNIVYHYISSINKIHYDRSYDISQNQIVWNGFNVTTTVFVYYHTSTGKQPSYHPKTHNNNHNDSHNNHNNHSVEECNKHHPNNTNAMNRKRKRDK
jgi:hypothetical protein